MTDEGFDHERRSINGGQRKQRVTAGGISAPLAIIVAYVVNKQWGSEMSNDVVIAISAAIGSAGSIVGICFWDLRGILLTYVYKRRDMDAARRRRK